MDTKQFIPSLSALAHLRLVFSFFLFPVFLFALSQTPVVNMSQAFLIFFIWHFLAFPASNGYNSYFDKDEKSIALLEKPPEVDLSLYYFSLLLEIAAFVLSFFISWWFAIAVLIYGMISKMYSHPSIRLKKYPFISFLVVFFFQGIFFYWSTYFALVDIDPFTGSLGHQIIAGAICSCLIGASYPLTQIYQHEEDRKRGDHTLSLLLGYKGSFLFSGGLFIAGLILTFFYWKSSGSLTNFYLFLICIAPIFIFFTWWFYKTVQNTIYASFKNAMRMVFISSICMVIYFGMLVWMR
ncbi:UbiA family prenyltransferase [Arcticibacter eurypsychrophilus]|uniref:UbiA family prenyltransferase n=1 Tax=Arcticibacter eurypsychrophilus TaxID=1434752 RepID=UPI00084DF105|nr:UbiA family prenyltransferase [Arcticibacter eurypsychrophilus]